MWKGAALAMGADGGDVDPESGPGQTAAGAATGMSGIAG